MFVACAIELCSVVTFWGDICHIKVN